MDFNPRSKPSKGKSVPRGQERKKSAAKKQEHLDSEMGSEEGGPLPTESMEADSDGEENGARGRHMLGGQSSK